MSDYWKKLQDPRWQKKRLEIMERDKFTCQGCFAKDKTLTVHHGYYEWGSEPWEYDDATLWTLCTDCHEAVRDVGLHFRYVVATIPPSHFLDAEEDNGVCVGLEYIKAQLSEAVEWMQSVTGCAGKVDDPR